MSESFDVFLSHNSKDKPTVRQLAQALKARGLRVWLDEEQLVPGRPWQEALEEIIQTARTAAVLVGKDGLGPWENPEMRACLSEFVNRHLPVIPVLLPDAPVKPKLPLFLRAFTWVDLRGGLTEANLNRLEWGIKGVKAEDSLHPILSPQSARRRWLLIGLCLVVLSILGVGGGFWYNQRAAWQHQVEDYIAAGEARLDIGRYGKAKESFQQALTLDPGNTKAQWGQEIASIEEERNPVLFEERIRRLHGKAPDDPHVNALLGRWHAAHHEPERAISYYQKAIEADPQLAEAYFGLGVLYDQQGDWEKAKAMYEKALSRSEGMPKYRSNLAYLYAKRGLYPQALEEYRKLPEQFILASQEIAALYRLLGEPEEALGYQQKAVQSLEDETVFQREENQDPWYFELGSEGIELPSLAEKRCYVYYSLALNLYLLGRETEAEEFLTKARQSTAIHGLEIQELIAFDLHRLAAAQPDLKGRLEDFQKRFLLSAARKAWFNP